MNIYLIIILFAIIGLYLLDMALNYLDIKSLNPELPAEFVGFYDKEEYKRSQEYSTTKAGFSYITTTTSVVIKLLVILLGGFNVLDLYVRSLGYSSLISGLIFIGLMGVISDVFAMPFELYSTFVIEEKFGFNKTTLKTFFSDKLKGYLLGSILGGVLLGFILYFFEATELAWLYCWITTSLFMLAVQFIAPTVIMPLFNKFTPIEDGELKSAINKYAEKIKFNLDGIFVIDGSKRSTKSNAFFTGFGSKKRIALFDTLIEKQTTGELVAILAHEVGHYKKKHIIKMLISSTAKTGLIFYLMSLMLENKGLFDAFKMDNISIYAGLIFFSILYTPMSFAFSVIVSVVSRKYEYEADRFAVETTGQGEDMINALKKLSVHNLSNLTPHKLDIYLNHSHPPVLARIASIRQIQGQASLN